MEEYTIVDAAKALGISKDTVRRRIKDGTIKAELRKSPFGKDMYYINPIELTGAIRNVKVLKVEEVVDLRAMQQAMQDAMQQAIEQAIEPLHKEIEALRAELAVREQERDKELMQQIREIQQEQQRPWWRKIFER